MPRTLGYHIVISGYGLWLPGDERGHWSEAKEDAEAFGITYATLRRAFRGLDGDAVRLGFPFKSWYWKLPTTAQKYEGEFCALNNIDEELAEILQQWTPNPTTAEPCVAE